MHALILAQQPHQVAIVTLVFDKLDQIVVIPLSGGHSLVRIVEGRFPEGMIVPLDASDFACFTTDAGGYIDVLANFVFPTCAGARHWSRMRRDFLNLECAWITHLLGLLDLD